MREIFISYKSDDRETAARLAEELERRGFSVWWDRDIPFGRSFDEVIEEALHAARCVVVLWSEASVTSDWVKSEAAEGAGRGILVPVRIERVDPPLGFRRIQTADLSEWDGSGDAPVLDTLIDSIEAKLRRSDVAPSATPVARDARRAPTRPTTVVRSVFQGWWSSRLFRGGALALAAVVLAVVWFGFVRDGGDGDGGTPRMTPDQAEAEIEALVANDVPYMEDFVCPSCGRPLPLPGVQLPPIDQYPLVVTASPNAVAAEIFVSTEKSGDESNGWMVKVAEAFNGAGIRLSNGRLANVEIRKIASGTGYDFIAAGRSLPDAYSPSNHLWIEMARANGVTMTPVREQLVSNVAGLVLRPEIADQLRQTYPTLTASNLVKAVIDDELVMAYTDPFISSTGLNFLTTVLWELSGGDADAMLTPEVEQTFRDFQSHVPFVADTTIQLQRALLEGDQLDAFVMEYQTFVQTDVLSGFEFIPFGVPHDNPLYAVGNVDDDTREVLESFAQYAERPEVAELARDYGFDPDPYSAPFAVPDGKTLISAQQVWKDNKDGGKPVTGVFVADVSGSMQGSRIAAVRDALYDTIDLINEQNLVGLVTFSDRVTYVLPIQQFDLDQARRFAYAVDERMSIGGGTAMYDGISVALSLLLDERAENPGAKLRVIVLTDGETKDGLSYADVSDAIAGLRIPIYTIGFEADIAELDRLSSLTEAASITANEDDLSYQIARLFNSQF